MDHPLLEWEGGIGARSHFVKHDVSICLLCVGGGGGVHHFQHYMVISMNFLPEPLLELLQLYLQNQNYESIVSWTVLGIKTKFEASVI